MNTRWLRKLLLGAVLGPICLTPACTPPMTEDEKAYFESRERDEEQREVLSEALQGETKQAEALRLVKDSGAVMGEGTTAEWIERLVRGEKGGIMFSRWTTTARGANKYEARFTYTVMEEDYRIQRKGFSWVVDLVLKKVSDPKALSEGDLDNRRSGQISAQQRKRRQKETFSLE